MASPPLASAPRYRPLPLPAPWAPCPAPACWPLPSPAPWPPVSSVPRVPSRPSSPPRVLGGPLVPSPGPAPAHRLGSPSPALSPVARLPGVFVPCPRVASAFPALLACASSRRSSTPSSFLVCNGSLLWNAFGLGFRPPLALAMALCCCCLRLAAVLPGCAFCATPCPVPCRVSVCVPSPRGLGGCSVPPGAMGPLAQGVPGDLGAPPRRPRPPVSPVGLAPRRLPHPAAARCVPSQSPRPSPSPGLRAGGAGWVCCRWAVSVPGGFALQRVGSSALPVA
jgi:hypothetical protein